MTPLEEEILVYGLANVFLGEGCIHIQRVRSRERRRGVKHRLQVIVEMGDEQTVKRFQQLWSGSCIYRPPRREGVNGSWRWSVASKKAREALRRLKPYLDKSEKAEQALVALMMPEVEASRPLTDEEFQQQEWCWSKLKDLKPRNQIRRAA